MRVFLYLSGLLGLVSGYSPFHQFDQRNEWFSRDLLTNLIEIKNQDDLNSNILFSPLSAFQALSMLYYGAGPHSWTRWELQKNLIPDRVRNKKRWLALMNRRINRALRLANRDDGISLSSANNLFAQEHTKIRREFKQRLSRTFNAQITHLNYSKPSIAAKEINKFVNMTTNGQIKEVVKPNDLKNPGTQMVLVNTLYFHGSWKFPFDGIEEKTSLFILAGPDLRRLDVRPVRMMYKTGDFKHIKMDHINLLELPYQGDKLVMEVVWPTNNIPKALDSVAYLRDGLKWTSSRHVKVLFPKFKLQDSIDMEDPFSKNVISIRDMFDQRNADFRGICKHTNLFVSKLKQQVVLEVNTEGTLAAAATTAVLSNRSALKVEELRVNQPFLVYIRHKNSNLILFKGLVRNPSDIK